MGQIDGRWWWLVSTHCEHGICRLRMQSRLGEAHLNLLGRLRREAAARLWDSGRHVSFEKYMACLVGRDRQPGYDISQIRY